MPNPQYYLICKQETRILVPKPSRAKEWMQDGKERER
jgi:hypothetical protein